MGDKTANRRDFLKLATTAAPVAAVAAATGTTVQAAEIEEHSDSYRETEHVRKYLDSARF
ncbi:MAG: twin-arginine translocation signal domain-containing protein [Pseudomonadota bacterium]